MVALQPFERIFKEVIMHRLLLKELLTSYLPADAGEKKAKLEMLSFLNDHTDCFERSLKKGHFTASAWVLNPDKSKALIMHHAKLNKWVQLGGHADGNPHLHEVAYREAQEESGIDDLYLPSQIPFDYDIHEIKANSKEPAHLHYDVRYIFRLKNDNDDFIISDESLDMRWCGFEEAVILTGPGSIARMLSKWNKL